MGAAGLLGALTRPSATLSQRERGFDTPWQAGVSVLEVKGLSGSWVKRRDPRGTAACDGMEQQQQLAHDGHEGHLAGLAAAPQTTIEALQFLVEPYG